MSKLSIQERLNQLLPKLQDSRLLGNRGIGNEIGFYVFDYAPEDELYVQEYTKILISQLTRDPINLVVKEFNLYNIILEILQEKGILNKAFIVEAKEGHESLWNKIQPIVRPEKVITQIQNHLQGNEQLVFLTGVGASWPLIRSHSILNGLQPYLDHIPLVLFFPGSYDGQELCLFNTFKSDNYYRAFALIPHHGAVYEHC